jgi:hypothetical protein
MVTLSSRWRCVVALAVAAVAVILAAAAATIGAVAYAPETVRSGLTKIGGLATDFSKLLPPTLPRATPIEKAHWLSQNWSERDRYWFHHTTQGTVTFPIPYDWFVALERPELSLFSYPRYLKDEDYLRRFGFIPSFSKIDGGAPTFGYRGEDPGKAADIPQSERPGDLPDNKHGLPVGFAKLKGGTDPATGKEYADQLGFTCAACHTGHIEYRNVSIRFDGGPAMVNLGELEKAVGLAIGYTLKVPFRFDRFADVVAQPGGRWTDRRELRAELERILQNLKKVQIGWEREILARNRVDHIEEGFGRLDALNRIGNQVFFEDMLPPDAAKLPEHLAANYARIDAPVSFPPIWDVPWFLWAQYDASILNELVRNAGETLGVNAKVNLTTYSDDKRPLFRSSANILNVHWFEEMLRGPDPFAAAGQGKTPAFKGLVAPKWAEVADIFNGDTAWQIDPDKVMQGRKLYRQHCIECHRGPVRDPDFDREWPEYSFWREDNPDRREKNWMTVGGQRYFNVVQKPVGDMGTDQQQSRVLTERQVKLPPELGLKPVEYLNAKWGCELPKDDAMNSSFTLALMAVVDRTVEQWFQDNNSPVELRKKMWGPRPNCQNRRVVTLLQLGEGATGKPVIVTAPHYRARPLDGVWATAPYLHNGSVPTLNDMLLPQDKRPAVFCVGSREFDPVAVGLKDAVRETCDPGVSRLDTTQLGNSNKGHSFQGTETDTKKLAPGVIGPELTPSERNALVEYLKTL